MKGSKGYYTGTRSLLKKPNREKGKPHIGKILQDYAPGSQVILACRRVCLTNVFTAK
jgi:ribosomal protein L21E